MSAGSSLKLKLNWEADAYRINELHEKKVGFRRFSCVLITQSINSGERDLLCSATSSL